MTSLASPTQNSIQIMFDKLARRYDLFNCLTSMGLDRVWRHKTLKSVMPGDSVLDLGCGSGDLALGAIARVGKEGSVTGIDFSRSMLDLACSRYRALGHTGNPDEVFLFRSAEDLPIPGKQYDVIVSGFVLRNVFEHIDAILDGVFRSLKPGGRIRFLDITEPTSPLVKTFWKFYMMTVVAVYGRVLFGKDYPAFYLTRSAERFFKPADFAAKLVSHGFQKVRARDLFMGIITLYEGERPA
ncbi:MAG TPA: ubiquinone/menaquinone biosynthesis methyltransferase [Candidatus Omnitrophota bacterium]|nr:ubiquinone/menaquinone biosynthesis methyltransferase [Candidatus Omnitrophota bacterium]